MRAQSSFTAVISTVVLVGILSFSLVYLSDVSGSVADDARRMEAEGVAIAVSNDLLVNPGYNGTSLGWRTSPEHFGLAEYDAGRRMVVDHVLDPEKIAFLQKEGIGVVERQYGIGNASLRIESLSGETILEVGSGMRSRLQVSRLALLEKDGVYGPVRVVFALEP